MGKTAYSLHLKGYVGGADFDRDYVDFVLGRNRDKDVAVLIDSTGGSLATALSIASAFKLHGRVSAHFVGMNASAATIASLGAAHVSIDTNAMYLVHKCSAEFFKWGSLNADQMAGLIASLEKQRKELDKLDANVAAMYAAKCKKKPQALLQLMKEGGWLTAKEALEWGFVDEVTDAPKDAAPRLTDAMASAMAAVGMPIPNVPAAESDSALGRFFAAIAALFKSGTTPTTAPDLETANISETNQTSNITKMKLPKICALLNIDDIAVSADGATACLSAAQLQHLEDALAEAHVCAERYEAEISSLQAKLAALPADSTTPVVNDASGNASHAEADRAAVRPMSALEAFAATEQRARKLWNTLPTTH